MPSTRTECVARTRRRRAGIMPKIEDLRMLTESEAREIARDFAHAKLLPSDGEFSLRLVPTHQVDENDWAFGFALVARSGAVGTPQIVLVDKREGRARTLRQAIREGWGRR